MISRNDIRDAIITALAPLHVQGGGECKEIAEYNPELLKDLNQLATRCPAIYVSYGGSSTDQAGQNNIAKSQTFSIFILYKSLHAKKTAERGAIGLLESIEDILEYNQLGLDIQPLEPAGDRFLAEENGITMYVADFMTGQCYVKEYTGHP